MRRITYRWGLALLLIAGGCAGITDLSISARNRSAAYKAWKGARWEYWEQGVSYKMREHIGRGFQQGYYDVANGGNGQVPLFPPGSYWGPEYQNPQGNELIAAWFRGYADGALAAEKSGIGGYHNLPTSWAPPYANDPNGQNGQNGQNGGGYGAPNGENVPPNMNAPPPQFPLPPQKEEALPKLPLEKQVGTPIHPGGSRRDAELDLQPGIVAPYGLVPPALSVPVPVIPVTPTVPTRVSPDDETPTGKQTFLPPGGPKPAITAAPAIENSAVEKAIEKLSELPESGTITK